MSPGTLRSIEWRVDDPADEWANVVIRVDGVSLIDLVREYEEARGYVPAGGYGWCPAGWTLPPSRHFLGEQKRPRRDGKVWLLFCDCQNQGCWDVDGRITVAAGHVEWADFEQVHRRPDSPGGHSDYGGFGPLRFDRRQYEAALAAARFS
jgi:hypothetical protein